MSTQVQYRRGTGTQNDAFTGALAEITVNTTDWTLRVHDGITAGGGQALVGNSATQTLTNKTLGAFTVAGNITGNLLPSANTTFNLGSNTQAWNSLYVAGNTIYLGALQLKDAGSNTFAIYTADGTTQANIDVGSIDVSGITQGTSAIGIAAANGNAYITVGGNANVLLVTSSGTITTGTASVTGTTTAGNLSTGGTISATGTATLGNVSTSGTISSTGTATVGNLSTGGTISATGNATAGNVSATGIFSTTLSTTGNAIVGNLSTGGTLSTSGNAQVGNLYSAGTANVGILQTQYTAYIAQTLTVDGTSNIADLNAGNANVGNLSTLGRISASGNITGSYIFGNGSQLTGIDATSIQFGTSNVKVNSSGGNATVSIGGTSNVVVFATTGEYVTGVVSASGTVTAGNLSTGGTLSATGNANVGNLGTGGIITATGTITGGNLSTGGTFSATGNANVGNLGTTGLFATTLSTTGTATVGNVSTGGTITATGNITTGSNLVADSGYVYVANGLYSTGSYNSTYTDGIVIDYDTSGSGNGRITMGEADGLLIRNQGVAAPVTIFAIDALGNTNTPGTFSASGNVYSNTALYVGDGAASTGLTNPIVVAKSTGLYYIQMAAQNSANTGSADLVAYADNGSDTEAWMDMGFTGSGFNDTAYTITKANDGYIFTEGGNTGGALGGNLVIATGGLGTTHDIVFGTGGFLSTNERMRFIDATQQFYIQPTTNATSTSTGALRVAGGAGVGGNIYAGGLISATGNITTTANIAGGNVLFGSGVVSGTGNITGGNVLFGSGVVSGTGTISGGNASISGNITSGNLNATGLSLSGNVVSALVSAADITTTANITGGNVLFGSGIVSGTGTISGGNASITGNITSGNLNATGLSLNGNVVSALTSAANITTTANITGGNVLFGSGVVSGSGTITGNGIISTDGMSATGNVTGAYLLGNARSVSGVTLANTVTDVTLTSPTSGQVLGYNGVNWVNANVTSSVSAGQGVGFWVTTPIITDVSANNFNQLDTLSSVPNTSAQSYANATINGTGIISAARSGVLNRTTIDAGNWDYSIWANVNNTGGTSSLLVTMHSATPFPSSGTVTITGTGTSRTVTASADSPFANSTTGGGNIALASYVNTPLGIFPVSAIANSTSVTITTPSTYQNETAVSGYTWDPLFHVGSTTLTSTSFTEYLFGTTQGSFPISTTASLGLMMTASTSASRTIYTTVNGSNQSTHFATPLHTLHDDLAGLQGGQSSEYYHMTAAEYTGTGTGNFVRASSPVLTTPNVGAATGTSVSVTGNITGGNVLFGSGIVSGTGNITGSYIFGNGSQLTGIDSTAINNGTSNVKVNSSGGNATVSIGGTPNVVVFANTGEYVTGLISASGNITGSYIFGNGSQLTGIDATSIQFGTSNVKVTSSGGNAAVSIGGTPNVVVWATTGEYVTGVVSASGNVTGGNLNATGLSLSGNVVSALVSAANITTTANISGGNVLFGSGQVIGTGNITGGNILFGSGQVSGTGNITTTSNVSGGNVLSSALVQGVTLSATGNVNGANLTTAGQISATGTITGGNLTTGGTLSVGGTTTAATINATTISASGNITGGNILGGANVNATLFTGTTVSVTGNITGGNVLFGAGIVSGTGNITATNLTGTLQTAAQTNITSVGTLTSLSVSGTATVGNVSTGGTISATGNITGGNLNATGLSLSGNVVSSLTSAANITTTANISGGNATITSNISSTTAAQNTNTTQLATTAFVIGQASSTTPTSIGTNTVGTATTFARADHTHTGVASLANGGGITASVSTGAVTLGSTATSANTASAIVARDASGNFSAGTITATLSGAATSATTAGTVTTAAQGNITSVGTLTSLSVSGNITGGNLSVSTGTISVGSIVNTNANAVGNIGATALQFNTVFAATFSGVSTTAKYADLAEKYSADADYEPGTVLEFGGDAEVTVGATDASNRVAGVVSTNPAHLMNSHLDAEFTADLALAGRVPVKVQGTVRKGDMMVSAGNGRARAEADPKLGTVIGKALENFTGGEGTIEVLILML